jgi:hypothetical protein
MEAAAQCPKLSLTHLSFKRDMILISINQATNQAINQSSISQSEWLKIVFTNAGLGSCCIPFLEPVSVSGRP